MNFLEIKKLIKETANSGITSLDLSYAFVEGANLPEDNLKVFISEIALLEQVIDLDLSGNDIEDISFLLELKRIKTVNLSENYIADVSILRKCTWLRKLNLRNNAISDASPLRGLKNLQVLDLRGNDLPFPEEILSNFEDAQKICNFLDDYYSTQKRKLNEAKLVIVGEANIGKTCLVNRLLRNEFVETHSTHGIQIEHWRNIKLENGEFVQMNVWDFGGQEIMHSTHQFFFTRRTVYILVVNARENQDFNTTEEWLLRIKNLSADSPVLIVGNKIDENNRGKDDDGLGYFDIDKKNLLAKFPNLIKGFFGVSSDVNKPQYDGLFQDFKKALIREIGNLRNIHDEFPASWISIKHQLEEMQANKVPYITFHDYLNRCEAAGIFKEQSQRTLIDFMHDLGIALSFQDDPELRDLAVLNPEWVTQGVYSLIDNAQIALNKGILPRSELDRHLDHEQYPTSTQDFIIKMMKKFKLLIEFNSNQFLIPDLLPREEPDTGEWSDCLHFQYSYEIYEKSILRQFIVDMFDYCSKETYWRHGMVLRFGDNRALVKADPKAKTILIDVAGSPHVRREIIGTIRIMIDQIHRTFDNLRYIERVGHPNHPNILRTYERLVQMETDGIEYEYVEELRTSLSVSDWLNGFQSRNDRSETQRGIRREIANTKETQENDAKAIEIKEKEKEKEKEFLLTQANRIARLRSRQLLFFTALIIISLVGFSVYFGFALIGIIFTVLIFLITYVVSHVRGKEWSFFKSPEQIAQDEYIKLLEARNLYE